MRREFTSIGAVSMLIYFLAGVVICLQAGQAPVLSDWRLPASVLWALDAAIAGAAVYLWRRDASLAAWALAVGVVVLGRLALTSSAAAAYVLLHEGVSFEVASSQMSQTLPRVCADLFALIVCYPVRSFLPARLRPERRSLRDASGPSHDFVGPATAGGDAALWFVKGDERIPVWMPGTRASITPEAMSTRDDEAIEGSVELPLMAVLAQVPQEMIGGKAASYGDSRMVAIPLAAIVPQLAEARVVVRLDDLADWLPAGALDLPRESLAAGAGGGGPALQRLEGEPPLVLLPLELVVPCLPEWVLELPPPSPPAWAEVAEAERVSFATV